MKSATVDSTNVLNFGFPYSGDQHAKLRLQITPKRGYGKSVLIQIENGQFLCGYPTCDLAIRFDNGKSQTFKAEKGSPAGTGDVLFFMNYDYDRLVNSLREAKKVRIEVEFFREGTRVLDFDIAGLDW